MSQKTQRSFSLIPFARGAQFVENSSGHERGRGNLRMGVRAFLAGQRAVILVDGNVLEPAVALQILDALPPGLHDQHNLIVGQILELAVVFGRLDDDFVRAHRLHLVVNSVGAALGVALHAIERVRMREHGDLRRALRGQTKKSGLGIRFLGTKRAAARGFAGVFPVSHDHPTARDGIFTKFHGRILSQGERIAEGFIRPEKRNFMERIRRSKLWCGWMRRFRLHESQTTYRVYRAGVGPSSRRCRSQIAPSRE